MDSPKYSLILLDHGRCRALIRWDCLWFASAIQLDANWIFTISFIAFSAAWKTVHLCGCRQDGSLGSFLSGEDWSVSFRTSPLRIYLAGKHNKYSMRPMNSFNPSSYFRTLVSIFRSILSDSWKTLISEIKCATFVVFILKSETEWGLARCGRINKQWEVGLIALEQLTSLMTLNAVPQQQRPESPTITQQTKGINIVRLTSDV